MQTSRKPNNELAVIVKAKDLLEYTLTITNSDKRYPKKVRFTMVQRIQNCAFDIVSGLYQANSAGTYSEQNREHRIYYQKQVIVQCQLLSYLIELSYLKRYIDMRTMEYWGQMADTVKNMTAGWIKSDRNRIKEHS